MKRIIILILLVVGLLILVNVRFDKASEDVAFENGGESMCFYRQVPVSREGFDVSLLTLIQSEGSIFGEFKNLPAETDSKIGEFEGFLVSDDGTTKVFDLSWSSFAEGMYVTEELRIEVSGDTARVGFGEMVDRGDSVYEYLDKENMGAWLSLSKEPCDYFNERIVVEDYLRESIASIAPKEAVLGGRWYVVSLSIDPQEKTGFVVYEDGHIQEQSNFEYEIGEVGQVFINFN